ncbi:MAG: hypothetical protein ACTSUD_14790 [Alphaproteobacteria bacterium]
MKTPLMGLLVLLAFVSLEIKEVAAQEPYNTSQGKACIRQWEREAMNRLNRYPDRRRPWRFDRFGNTVNAHYVRARAPDDWNSRWRGNRYFRMWYGYNTRPPYWRDRAWNGARVPSIRSYVRACLRRTGGGYRPPSPPASRAFCNRYARSAVSQNQQNNRWRCNYRGGRWQSNYRNHYNWCVRAPRNTAGYEQRQRAIALNRCRARSGGTGRVQRFNYPRWNGAIVDHCVTWARNCGQPGANNYCRRRGYRRAVTRGYRTYRPGRTYVIGARRLCTGNFCIGFRYVNCTR